MHFFVYVLQKSNEIQQGAKWFNIYYHIVNEDQNSLVPLQKPNDTEEE